MRRFFTLLTFIFQIAFAPMNANAQQRLHVGLGAVPGIGAEVTYVQVNRIFTMEGLFLAGFAPGLGGSESTLATSLGLGGGIRILDILSEIGRSPLPGYHLDAGVHLGPSLRFVLDNQTAATRNTRFRLFLEPFARLSTSFGSRTFYVELGTLRPILRAGLALSF